MQLNLCLPSVPVCHTTRQPSFQLMEIIQQNISWRTFWWLTFDRKICFVITTFIRFSWNSVCKCFTKHYQESIGWVNIDSGTAILYMACKWIYTYTSPILQLTGEIWYMKFLHNDIHFKHCATSRRVPGWIPGRWGFFPGHQTVPCALGSTLPLKMSIRIFLGVKTAGA